MEKIKVLWIEDQVNSEDCKAFRTKASILGIQLIQKGDWKTGKEFLLRNRSEISAIVLDCYCKLTPEDSENSKFLNEVIAEIDSISNQYGKLFPWYILSAGSRDDFSAILQFGVRQSRDKWDKSWSKIYYSKLDEDNDLDHLIENIKGAASIDEDYNLRQIYHKVVAIMESDYFDSDSLAILLKILKPLHFVNHRASFDAILHYNQMRQFVEKIFRACHKQSLLPNECIENGKLNLWESSRYLSGEELQLHPIRFGEKGERILPDLYSRIIQQILFVSNGLSHSSANPSSQFVELSAEDEGKVRNIFQATGASNFLFGYALQLCDIIIWLNKYFDEHTPEKNLAKQHKVQRLTKDEIDKLISEATQEPAKVLRDENGNVFCGKCLLNSKVGYLADNGCMITPMDVVENINKNTKDRYPLYCKKYK